MKNDFKKSRAFLCSLFLAFSFLFCSPVFSQAASQQTTPIQTLSEEIHKCLADLKQQSRTLTEQLLLAENELEMSSKQVEELKTELNDLNSCMILTNEKLSSYSEKLTAYEQKLKKRAKIITWGAVLLVLFLLTRVALVILKVKFGIKIPYTLNLLL